QDNDPLTQCVIWPYTIWKRRVVAYVRRCDVRDAAQNLTAHSQAAEPGIQHGDARCARSVVGHQDWAACAGRRIMAWRSWPVARYCTARWFARMDNSEFRWSG